MSKSKILLVACIPLVIFLIFWIGSIVHSEILTFQYGSIFESIIEEDSWHGGHGHLRKVKVLDYSDTFAHAYYTWDQSSKGGATLEFEKIDGEWSIISNDTIWSSTGSADGFVWPFIR